MHTVRNRLASRPPVKKPAPSGQNPPHTAALQHLQRGSMAVPLAVPDSSGLVEPRSGKRRNPKGKKARKAAARLAAAREAQSLTPGLAEGHTDAGSPRMARRAGGKTHTATLPTPVVAPAPAAPVMSALADSPVLDQCLAAEPALALTLPMRPEPLVAETPARVLTFDAMPELKAEEPEPFLQPLHEPEDGAMLLADVPLPRARALVPARRQGLVDVIAFLLRDSGLRLARWSARRHKSKAERAALQHAEARQLNLQRELDALDTLRRNRG